MATPKWEPGKLYPPGSLVLPRTAPHSLPAVVVNAGFETGDLTGWTADANLSVAHNGVFEGAWALQLNTGVTGAYLARSNTRIKVKAGTVINAQMMIHQGASNVGNTGGIVKLFFYDESNVEIAFFDGNNVNDGRGGAILPSRVRATVPVGADTVGPGVVLYRNGENFVTNADAFTWDLIDGVDSGLQYKAVQPLTGYSGTDEPVWPINLGEQVIDNEVIWEAVATSRIVWEARAVLKSGTVEPVWPEAAGATVADGSIAWVATDNRITDPKLPLSKIVTVARYKVFVGDGNTVAYCATLNANDWSSIKDAGFIGTGLQENGANKVSVLNQYNGDLVVMSSSTFQNWQIDPDPQLIDLLTTKNGIGSSWHLAAVPVNDDLFYLSPLGVRTIGVSGASNNLRSGDVGSPIDVLVRAKVAELLANEVDKENTREQPLGGYYPSSGQYWLSFSTQDAPPSLRRLYQDWIPYIYSVTFNGTSTNGGANAGFPSVKWAVGVYHPVKKVYQDVATLQWSNSTNNLYLHSMAISGNIVYSMMPYVWSTALNNIGIFATQINYGTRELEPVANWRIPNALEENAYLCFGMSNGHLLVVHDNLTTFITMYSIKLEGNAFVLKDTLQIITQHGDAYCCEAGDRVGLLISTNGANPEQVGLYSADATTGEITEHGLLPVPVGTVSKPRFGQPICHGDGYLYAQFNGDEFVPGLRVYNTAGGVLTEVLSELVPPGVVDNYGMTAGGGKVMQFDYTNDGDINVRTFDGTTMSANIQVIPAWFNVKPFYDAPSQLLFSPADTPASYNFGGNILKWNSGTGQFVQETSKFFIMPYNSDDTGYGQNFIQPFFTKPSLPLAPEVTDEVGDVYYVYMGNNNLYQVGDYSAVKIAYGKYNLETGTYTDLAIANVMGASVWMQGGIAVNSGFIFAATGYDDTTVDIADRIAGGAGLYVYEVDIDSNTLTELDRYIPAKISTDNSCITSPIVMDDGVVIVIESAQNLVNSLDIVGFSFDGVFLTEVFRETLAVTDVTNSEQLLRYGEYILLGTYDGAYAFTYSPGVGITQVAFDAGGPDIVQLTASKAEVRGSYIITRTGTNGVRTWTFNGAAFTLVATLASVSGTGMCVLEDGADLIIGRDLDNANNAFFNGFNRLQFYRFSGAVVTPLGIEVGHSPYQPLFVANNLLFVPYPSGIRFGGLVDNPAGGMGVGYVPTGVYSWDGDSLVTEMPRFLLSHSMANADNGQYGLRGFQTVPKLHGDAP